MDCYMFTVNGHIEHLGAQAELDEKGARQIVLALRALADKLEANGFKEPEGPCLYEEPATAYAELLFNGL